MTPSNAELKNELTQLLDTIYGRDSAPTADKILVLFQAREQQLLTELYGIYQNEPTIQKGYEALVAELFTRIEKYREGL